MAIIQSDNPEIEKELRHLEKLIEQSGGGIHSDVILFSKGYEIGVKTKGPMQPGKELIRLARGTLLPDDCYDLGAKNGNFTVDFPKHSPLSPLQRELTTCMISLYNLTDKVGFQKKVSFLFSLLPYPELLDYIGRGRQYSTDIKEWRKKLEDDPDDTEIFNDFISKTFLKTRHLGYNDQIRATTVSVLMPVIDFMNHHWQGAAFHVGLGVRQGDLSIMNSQPIEGSLDCFAFYDIMDSLDSLIRYDFIDEFSPIIRSIPLELNVPDAGTIKIDSKIGSMNKKKLEKNIMDLNRFLPVMTLNKAEKTLFASHIMIPTGGSPRALRRTLYILLGNLLKKEIQTSIWKSWVEKAESEILEKNNTYYNGLMDLTKKHIKEHGTNPSLERIKTVAELQLKKLSQYHPPA